MLLTLNVRQHSLHSYNMNKKERSAAASSYSSTRKTLSSTCLTGKARAYVAEQVGKKFTKHVDRNPKKRHKKKQNNTILLCVPEGESVLKGERDNVFYMFDWSLGKGESGISENDPSSLPHTRVFHVESLLENSSVDWKEVEKRDANVIIYKESKDESSDDPIFVCAKVSKRQARELRNKSETSLEKIRQMFSESFEGKPTVPRGESRGGFGDDYICYGWTHRFTRMLHHYVFLKKTSLEKQDTLRKGIDKIAQGLEDVAVRVMRGVRNFKKFYAIKKFIDLPSVSTGTNEKDELIGICTQMAVAFNGYQSKLHIDDDFFLSILSVVSACPSRDDEIIYYFNFPTFNLSVPMRPGDILIFDSNFQHCCSNPKNKDDYIYSMYVSNAAVDTKMREVYRKEVLKEKDASNSDVMDKHVHKKKKKE